MKKNDQIELYIEDIGIDGSGIGHAEGMTFFVKDALIGDRILAGVTKLKKNYGYARLQKILDASPDRVEAACPIARPCGGCQFQTLAYEKQLEFKQKKVTDSLIRIGGLTGIKEIMEPIIGMQDPWRYRNKAQYPVGYDRDGNLVAGFFAGRTHQIIPCEDCKLGAEENRKILQIILGHMNRYQISAYNETDGTGLVRHVLIRKAFSNGQLLVCLILNGDVMPEEEILADSLFSLSGMTSFSVNTNTKRTNVILGDRIRVVRGEPFIIDTIGSIQYRISPKSFFQVNPVQTAKLYGKALEFADLNGTETVWDLYCGIGTISLFLAQKARKVYGVEIVPEAIEDARENARLNGIGNAEFFVGKSEEILPAYYERERQQGRTARADVIVVDPPRKGCDPVLLDTILAMEPDRIVYVSCDPATLARDLKILTAGGYTVKKVQPTDMFPHSVHVETVCCLYHQKKDFISVPYAPKDAEYLKK